MSQHHIVLSDRKANSVWLPNSNESAPLAANRGQRHWQAGQVFPEPVLAQLGEGDRGLELAPFLPRTPGNLLLISLLTELCGSAVISRSNFPLSLKNPFLSGIVVKRQKAAWLSSTPL